MSAPDPAARLAAICDALAPRTPAVLAEMAALLDAMIATVDLRLRAGRADAAPGALTAEQVREAARDRGVPALGEATAGRLILLGSLGLDLADPAIRAALIDLHRRGELCLAAFGDLGAVREGLAARGLRAELADESALRVGDTTFHAVALL